MSEVPLIELVSHFKILFLYLGITYQPRPELPHVWICFFSGHEGAGCPVSVLGQHFKKQVPRKQFHSLKCEGHCNSTNKMEAAEAAAAFQSHSVPDNLWVKRKPHQGPKSLNLLWHRTRITSQVSLFKSQCPRLFTEGFLVHTQNDHDRLSKISLETVGGSFLPILYAKLPSHLPSPLPPHMQAHRLHK